MNGVIVDSNVILDVFLNDLNWADWSESKLEESGRFSPFTKEEKGVKKTPVPDFFIGAQAAVLNLDLLTRDVSRYRSYFTTVK